MFLLVDTVSGASHSIAGALFGVLLVLLVAVFLVLGAPRTTCTAARGAYARSSCSSYWRSRSRTPLSFQAGRLVVGGPILVVALAVLYLLFTPPSRAALDREITR